MDTGPCHAWATDAFRCCHARLKSMSPWLQLPGTYNRVERERESQEALFELRQSHQRAIKHNQLGGTVATLGNG